MYQLYGKHEITGQDIQAIKRLEDNASVPFDHNNVDFQLFIKWLKEGNTPEPAANTTLDSNWVSNMLSGYGSINIKRL